MKKTDNVLGFLVGILIIGVIVFLLWPWTLEGTVSTVAYTSDNMTFIRFDDGRVLRLRGVPSISIYRGKYYTVTYNCIKVLYGVEEK